MKEAMRSLHIRETTKMVQPSKNCASVACREGLASLSAMSATTLSQRGGHEQQDINIDCLISSEVSNALFVRRLLCRRDSRRVKLSRAFASIAMPAILGWLWPGERDGGGDGLIKGICSLR